MYISSDIAFEKTKCAIAQDAKFLEVPEDCCIKNYGIKNMVATRVLHRVVLKTDLKLLFAIKQSKPNSTYFVLKS